MCALSMREVCDSFHFNNSFALVGEKCSNIVCTYGGLNYQKFSRLRYEIAALINLYLLALEAVNDVACKHT